MRIVREVAEADCTGKKLGSSQGDHYDIVDVLSGRRIEEERVRLVPTLSVTASILDRVHIKSVSPENFLHFLPFFSFSLSFSLSLSLKIAKIFKSNNFK